MLRNWLLFAHITGAIIYVGSDLLLTVLVWKTRRSGAVAEFLRTVETASPIAGLGGALLLLSGLGLVLAVDAYGIGTAFVLVGLSVILVSGAAEALYFGRQAAALHGLIEQAPESPEIGTRLTQLLTAAIILDVLKLVAIWAMVFKPGA